MRPARGGICSSCGRRGELEENDLCAPCDDAYVESIGAAERRFELGADYGRVMGWYDEPSGPWDDPDFDLSDQGEPW